MQAFLLFPDLLSSERERIDEIELLLERIDRKELSNGAKKPRREVASQERNERPVLEELPPIRTAGTEVAGQRL